MAVVPGPLSRRTVLAGLGLGALTLAGCSRREPTPPGTDATSGTSGGGGGSASGRVRIALAASNQQYEPFLTEQFRIFNQTNPGVQIEPRFFPPGEYANAIQLSFTGSDAPDLYRLTGPSPAVNMVNSYRNGWLQPMTSYLTEDVRGRGFVEGTFDDPTRSGLYIGEDLYGMPLESLPYTQIRILYCNTALLEAAGASGPPATWEEMADLAGRITADSGEGVHGFAVPGNNAVVTVDALAATGGVPMSGNAPLDHRTGLPGASSDHYVAVVELLRDMAANSVFTPGWETWDPERPIQEFAAGRLGMYVGANFHAARFRELNPDLDFTIAAVPVPASGRAGFQPVRGLHVAYWGMSADAVAPEAAWSLLDFMSTIEFQMAAFENLRLLPVLAAAYEGTDNPDTLALLEVQNTTQKIAPGALFNGPDADLLLSQATANAPTPTAVQRYTLAMTENSDYRGPAEEFDAAWDPIIDQTVTELQDQGTEVTRDALVFPDWDPMEDYQG